MTDEASHPQEQCKQCKSEYRCIAYTMGSGDIMAVKECNCSLPSTHDVTAQGAPERARL
jgi:hypothetical protein